MKEQDLVKLATLLGLAVQVNYELDGSKSDIRFYTPWYYRDPKKDRFDYKLILGEETELERIIAVTSAYKEFVDITKAKRAKFDKDNELMIAQANVIRIEDEIKATAEAKALHQLRLEKDVDDNVKPLLMRTLS